MATNLKRGFVIEGSVQTPIRLRAGAAEKAEATVQWICWAQASCAAGLAWARRVEASLQARVARRFH